MGGIPFEIREIVSIRGFKFAQGVLLDDREPPAIACPIVGESVPWLLEYDLDLQVEIVSADGFDGFTPDLGIVVRSIIDCISIMQFPLTHVQKTFYYYRDPIYMVLEEPEISGPYVLFDMSQARFHVEASQPANGRHIHSGLICMDGFQMPGYAFPIIGKGRTKAEIQDDAALHEVLYFKPASVYPERTWLVQFQDTPMWEKTADIAFIKKAPYLLVAKGAEESYGTKLTIPCGN
jgi:hypothetical protein